MKGREREIDREIDNRDAAAAEADISHHVSIKKKKKNQHNCYKITITYLTFLIKDFATSQVFIIKPILAADQSRRSESGLPRMRVSVFHVNAMRLLYIQF